ncbi:ATP-dependent DNA helicase RecQ [Virgibacillus natechei]|uniref:ATP-dependent DNA helicase RecQ n=1 Tax=Virgibacillus natechei TaxID=1216297 RepID=A0ABS4IFB5_9BACI|nr:ATP-dependent DNA helicase RecQ [Virgibacillus natechei]MBP1969637.1 ATP-dependent DNA helicase RecQ [Virgibacillus natechei]UZD11365.1 ATP-dependent DNA helicase [Virgibacillus natechei]
MSTRHILEEKLKTHFNYTSFRLGQKAIIEDVMSGKDVLGVLPTGSGKSICYQLPATLLDGVTIVVSPLISLMIDQVKELKAFHFKKVVALNSFMSPTDRKLVFDNLHTYKLIYISPELLQKEEVLGRLRQLHISLFVIDEAHCISQWGHEFRPDYLKLNSIIRTLKKPSILALSATATPAVQQDIISALNTPSITKHVHPMDRDNISFSVERVMDDKEKQSTIINLLSHYNVATLIYFSSRQATEDTAKILSEKLASKRIAYYHGGMEQGDRITIQQQFMNDQLDIICCTSAFGMGINKDNIRLVIHFHLPLQIESYIQEVGRAGRDGETSASLLLFSEKDIYLPKNMIKSELPSFEDLKVVFQQLQNLYKAGDQLPKNGAENLFQISETQWRFLQYQFEKHGMIEGNNIIFHEENWRQAFQWINNHRAERTLLKENKLREMLQWIHESECLRKHLYKSFQSSYNKPKYQCCSNCGFSFTNWKPKQKNIKAIPEGTWESKLKNLLLIGEE